jgi:D-xylose transport system substrate-binding protein
MVEYIADRVPSGNCIALWGDANDANAIFIKTGQERALNSYNEKAKLNVVYKTYIEDWDRSTARKVVGKVLDFSAEKIDAIVSSNVPLAIGAYDALSEHGYKPGEVIITGMDIPIDFVHSLLNGGMTMSVNKPIKELAYGAINLAVGIVKDGSKINFTKTVNNGRKDVPAKLFTPIVIDKSNFEKELIDKGFYTREQVFN